MMTTTTFPASAQRRRRGLKYARGRERETLVFRNTFLSLLHVYLCHDLRISALSFPLISMMGVSAWFPITTSLTLGLMTATLKLGLLPFTKSIVYAWVPLIYHLWLFILWHSAFSFGVLFFLFTEHQHHSFILHLHNIKKEQLCENRKSFLNVDCRVMGNPVLIPTEKETVLPSSVFCLIMTCVKNGCWRVVSSEFSFYQFWP